MIGKNRRRILKALMAILAMPFVAKAGRVNAANAAGTNATAADAANASAANAANANDASTAAGYASQDAGYASTLSSANTPAHHLPDGTFRNNYIKPISKPAGALAKWRRESPGHPPLSFPLFGKRDAALLRDYQYAATWIGHATVFLQLDGVNILTDPHFSNRASPVSFLGPKRTTPPGFSLAQLPPIDIVVLSHNHYDHLDSRTIRALAKGHKQPLFFAPLEVGKSLRAMGVHADNVRELDWHQSARAMGLTLTALPCQHWSSRLPWDRNETLWAAWRIQSPKLSALFIGDTGYSKDFADIRARYGKTDMAIIPIGAYEPRWFMKDAHINPQESVRIFQDIGAKFAIASHWGTFQLTDEMMDEPPKKLQQARQEAGLSAADFAVLQPGETRDLSAMIV